MQNFERIKKHIMASSLAGDDKMALNDVFADFPDEHLSAVADLLDKEPSLVQRLSENRRKKIQALSAGNQTLWAEIMAEEKSYLESLPFDND